MSGAGLSVRFAGGDLLDPTALLVHDGDRHTIGTVHEGPDGLTLKPSHLGESLGIPAEGITAPTEGQLTARIAERVKLPGRKCAEANGIPSLL